MNTQKLKIGIVSWLMSMGIGYNQESIIFFWKKTFLPNWHELTDGMSDLEILRDYVWSEKLPIILIFIIIFNYISVFTVKNTGKNDYSNCSNFWQFIKNYNKIGNQRRLNLLVNSALILVYQIYKQIRYNYGFVYSYGALFVILPLVHIIGDFCCQLAIWKRTYAS